MSPDTLLSAQGLNTFYGESHILHDRDEHRRQRWFTYRLSKAAGDPSPGRTRFGSRGAVSYTAQACTNG